MTTYNSLDLVGHRFGALLVLAGERRRIERNGKRKSLRLWRCRCDCGSETFAPTGKLRTGRKMSCGCSKRDDLTGQRFGRLVVVERVVVPRESRRRHDNYARWRCVCDCGREKVAASDNLKKGSTSSCGCLAREARSAKGTHRLTLTVEYRALRNAIRRCHEPRTWNFERYGGRGVVVCDRWRFGENGKTGPECFIADVGLRPGKGWSLDRIDVNGDYAPGTVRWASKRLQADNKRATKWVTVFGERMSLGDLAIRMKVMYRRLYYQIVTMKRSPEEALQRLGVRIPVERAA